MTLKMAIDDTTSGSDEEIKGQGEAVGATVEAEPPANSATDVREEIQQAALNAVEGGVPANGKKSDSAPPERGPGLAKAPRPVSLLNRLNSMANSRQDILDQLQENAVGNVYVNRTVPPEREIQDVVDFIGKERHVSGIDALPSHESEPTMRAFLRRFFNRGTVERVKFMSTMLRNIEGLSPNDYYEKCAFLKAYYSGRTSTHVLASDLQYDNIIDLLYNEDGSPKRIISIGCGDGDDLSGLDKARKEINKHIEYRNQRSSLGFMDSLLKLGQGGPKDPDLLGLDITESFPHQLESERRINGMQADICDPDFFEKYGERAQKGGWDIILMNLILDRLERIDIALENIKHLARDNNASKFHIGLVFPFSNLSDSLSEMFPPMVHWKREADIRAKWMGSDTKNALIRTIWGLWGEGLLTNNISKQSYAVVSPHGCMTVADLRKKYQENPGMIDLDLYDEETRENICAALRLANPDTGKVPEDCPEEDHLIVVPQVYSNFYKLSGTISKKSAG